MRGLLLLAALWLALLAPVQAQEQDSPGDMLRISLLTFAPGEVYWQRFGHNALLVENTATGANAVYNYGMFDFFQKNFFLNFARGEMQYWLDADTLDRTLQNYAAEGRWAYQQVLDLDAGQRLALAAFLARNAEPDQAQYRYDYFRDNCSTRVRDAIDRIVGGALKQQLQAQRSTVSYRFEATRLVAPIPALMAGMDLIMGPAGDTPINVWQQSFVPEVLMHAVQKMQVNGKPLVLSEGYLLTDTRSPMAPEKPLNLLPLTLSLGLLLGIALPLLAARRQQGWARFSFAAVASVFWLFCALGGLILLAVWTLTAHWVMWANYNLLLVMPLCLLLLPTAFRSFGKNWHPARWQRQLALAIALVAVLSLPLALLPNAQQQWQWIALFLPVHLGLALALRRVA